MKQLAVSYIRFSSLQQGKGSTTERQQRMVDQWLAAHPEFELSKASRRDEGKSGYRGEHLDHGLGEILKAVEDGEIPQGSVLLVEALDRLGRLEPMQMISMIGALLQKGVNVVTLEDGQLYDRNSANNNLLFLLAGKVQMAHQYSASLSRRIKDAYEKKRRDARDGQQIKKLLPAWLTSGGKLIPDKAEAVQKCIDLYLNGYGTRRILLMLMKNYPWLKDVHPSTMKRWFSNRAIVGDWETNGEVIQGAFEPLISLETWYALQQKIESKTKVMTPEEKYELSGLVVCGCCSDATGGGSKFYFRRKKYREYTIIYANCSRYLKRGLCANNTTIPYEVLMFIYRQTYGVALGKAAMGVVDKKKLAQLELVRNELAELGRALESLLDLYVETPLQAIKDRVAKLNEKRNDLLRKQVEYDQSLREDTISQSEDVDDANTLFDAIEQDSVRLRTILQESKYEIVVRGRQLEVDLDGLLAQYELIERSVKNKCYILKVHAIEDVQSASDSSQKLVNNPYYVAVDRAGVVAVALTLDALGGMLESKPAYQRDQEMPGLFYSLESYQARHTGRGV